MERDTFKDQGDKGGFGIMLIAGSVIDELRRVGVNDFCICPGARNAALIQYLLKCKGVNRYYFNDERSAAFFTLGKARFAPAAIITTSGSAVGELLPATMEGYYSGLPLVMITADRPRRMRRTGAPQTCEQVGIFGKYAQYHQDLAEGELCNLESWQKNSPCHINVCFEEL